MTASVGMHTDLAPRTSRVLIRRDLRANPEAWAHGLTVMQVVERLARVGATRTQGSVRSALLSMQKTGELTEVRKMGKNGRGESIMAHYQRPLHAVTQSV